ncbi:spore germination protein [Paenibacillus frigoriresistens]|uniref:spore germination protein n=1 Tax=Paenibacillus alginolyticus TaxID=59839 RepID=UPI00156627BE|nr:spore germination protein [Paenibacillus frigoriresistens]NRF93210.1 spore germination protein [Paenibacillus frigoriresistens]
MTLFRKLLFSKVKEKQGLKDLEKNGSLSSNVPTETLSLDVSTNEQLLRGVFKNCSDVVFRSVQMNEETNMLYVYIDGLCDTKILDQVVLKPFLFEGMPQGIGEVSTFGQIFRQQLVAVAKIKTVSKVSEVVESVLMANVAILVNGESNALIADLKGFEKRSIEEPASEPVIHGPRDGFTETLRVNTSLIRRRIRSPRLKIESFTIGELTKTGVEVLYIEGIAPDSVLGEVRKRIQRIQIDGVLDSGYLEEFVEDLPFSPFPQVQNTERPDVVCASLLEGKVAICVDNTPFVLIVPMTFWSGLQAAEDYYERFLYATFIRWIRYSLLSISLLLPSIYVAVTTFHPQLLPTNLLISIASAREGVPFPAVVEALMMEFMFEALREAGVRLPKPVGSAVSIVGALVIGQSAVQAGIISAPMVIVVATTGIASFGIPRYNLGTAYRLLRFTILILAGLLGFYGILVGCITILIHLVCLRSFGVPYLSPIAPQIPGNLKDVLIRAPRWSLNYRPELIAGNDKKRIPEGQQPSPERGNP